MQKTITITMEAPEGDQPAGLFVDWSIDHDGYTIDGGRSDAPLINGLAAALLALLDQERPEVAPADQHAADLLLAVQANVLHPLDLARLLGVALRSEAAPLVAAALVTAGAWPRPAPGALDQPHPRIGGEL